MALDTLAILSDHKKLLRPALHLPAHLAAIISSSATQHNHLKHVINSSWTRGPFVDQLGHKARRRVCPALREGVDWTWRSQES